MPTELVILIVEDHPAVSASLKLLVEHRAGVTVLSANGYLAAAIWINSAARIDLLLCEMRLAGEMDGADVAELAVKTHPLCTAVLFVNAVAPAHQPLHEQYQVVLRPFKQAEVMERIDRAVLRCRVQAE